MFTRLVHPKIVVAIIAAVFCAASFAEQAGPSSGAMQMSPEARKDMAGMHRKMADCLDSGSSSHDCMQTMMKDCPIMAKTGHCPMADTMQACMSSAKPAVPSQAMHIAMGTVTKIDAGAGTVTLAHEAVETMKWPAMTMGFKVKDKTLMDKLDVGKKVKFTFQQEDKDFVVISVK